MLKTKKVEEWLKTQMHVSASLLGSLDTNLLRIYPVTGLTSRKLVSILYSQSLHRLGLDSLEVERGVGRLWLSLGKWLRFCVNLGFSMPYGIGVLMFMSPH